MKSRLLFFSVGLPFVYFIASFLSACAPVQGYAGPALPPEQVSTISFSNNSSDTDYDGAEIDGISFGYAGINVLPGVHRYSFGVTAKERPFDCRGDAEMDHYGYDRCLKKRDRNCDCYDFLTVYEVCYREIYEGRCEGQLTTRAGTNYTIRIDKDREGARASVPGSGEASCGGFRRRVDTERTSKGTGRSAAYAAGVYGCR